MILFSFTSIIFLTAIFLIAIRATLFQTGHAKKLWRTIEDWFHVYQFFQVPELNETTQHNHLYKKVSLYLHSVPSIEDSDLANLITGKKQNDIVLCLGPNQTMEDHFLGATLFWFNQTGTFVLKIRKVDKRRILRPYLQHIHAVADEIDQQGKRDLRLFMNTANDFRCWRSIPFMHPLTFNIVAMEPDLKSKVKSDLELFLRAKQYYHRLGRVLKRSFLLYGPSGIEKSSFVAAMTNFLSYDVYKIGLCKISCDSDLKSLLLQMTPKSMVVIEDLDRFLAEKTARIKWEGVWG